MNSLSYCSVSPAHQVPLCEFFAELVANGDDRLFHPHPFTSAHAQALTAYAGKDIYSIAIADDKVLAYGMLRGWDEGYEIPSLGIAVAKFARGTGLARSFMLYLHSAARLRGSRTIRLTVYAENLRAHGLYESMGYRFELGKPGQLVGICPLERQS